MWDVYAVPNANVDTFSLMHVTSVITKKSGFDVVLVRLPWEGTDVPDLDDLDEDWPNFKYSELVSRSLMIHGPLPDRHWVLVGTRVVGYGTPGGWGTLQAWGSGIPSDGWRKPHLDRNRVREPGPRLWFWRLDRDPPEDYRKFTRVSKDQLIPWADVVSEPDTFLELHGPDSDFDAKWRGGSRIAELSWYEHDRRSIDLSNLSRLRKVATEYGEGLEELHLNESAKRLSLSLRRNGAGPAPRVSHATNGRDVWLQLRDGTIPESLLGLDNLRRLSMMAPQKTLDLEFISAFPKLEILNLWVNEGRCENLERLADLNHLRMLNIYDAYDFDAESVPTPETWPHLDTIGFYRLPKSSATILRKRLKNAYRLEIKWARGDKWLAENVGNPLARWVDIDEKLGKKAAKAYVTARRAVATGDASPVIRKFLETLNAMERDLPIETMERGDAWDATLLLAHECGLSEVEAQTLFDAIRVF